MLSHGLYLVCLLSSIGCLALLDRRFKLALWADRRAALISIVVGVCIFVVWDIFGIGLHIFSHGNSPYSLPFLLFGTFPVEELFFLMLLCYNALLLYRGAETLWPRT
jgi:lycopene cyclase domain-containing protein